jgi:hypothetical protein
MAEINDVAIRTVRGRNRSAIRPAGRLSSSIGRNCAIVTPLSARALPVRSSTTSDSARFWNQVPVSDRVWPAKYSE